MHVIGGSQREHLGESYWTVIATENLIVALILKRSCGASGIVLEENSVCVRGTLVFLVDVDGLLSVGKLVCG